MFDWLTPEIRKAIYGFVTVGLTFALAYDIVSTEQVQLTIDLLAQVVMALTALMAFLKTNIDPR